MTDKPDPRAIVVRYPADGDGPANVTIGDEVTVGQLVMAAWELERTAEDARRGQLLAQAHQRAGLLVPVPGNGLGRRT